MVGSPSSELALIHVVWMEYWGFVAYGAADANTSEIWMSPMRQE